VRRTIGKQTPQEFQAGALPVVHILTGYFPPHEDGSRMPLQVAVFDTSTRPDLDLQDLTRLIASESLGESETAFAWDCCETHHDLLIRLTCAYQTPVQGQFALLFRYRRHRDYLRWVVEHGNTVPIADVSWSEQLASEHPLFLCPPDEAFASRLRLLRLHQQMTKEQRTTLTEPEIASILFEVKRVASYGELARFAEEVLRIPVSGTDSEYFPNAFAGPETSLQVQQLSRDFHRFLVHVMLVPGMTAGHANGTVYFFTEDWLAEHPTDLLKPT
jgi:hypothetical protein